MAESPKADSPDSPSQPALKSNSGAGQKRNKVSRACDECRKRKVRCDGAQPCQRCVSAKKECNFVKVVPKRGPPKKYVETLEPRLRAVEQILDALKLDVVESTSRRSERTSSHDPSDVPSSSSSVPSASPSIGHNSPTDSLAVGAIGQGLYVHDGMLRVDRIPCIYDEPASNKNFSPPFMAINYTEPAQPKLHPHVIAATSINADLIQVYFSRVHPYLPILHKNTFHKQIQIAPCMLLLNAMYAVASKWHHASNDISNGQPAGWRYYQAAFSLIDIYTDTPRLSTIQALLLLIKYQEHVRRPGYFWRTRQYFQIILRMSRDLGLNKSLPPNAQIDPITAEQRKRTFWAVYAYDILMSTELGTEPYFNAKDCTVDYPNLLMDESQTEEHETMLHFHWMAKVVHLHGDVVNFARQRFASGSQEMERDQTLRTLQQRVEETGTFMMSVIKPTSSSFSSSFLLMLLHLSTILLHRPNAVGNEASVSQERCTDSASAITHLVGNLLRSGGLECMYYPIRGIQYTIHCLSAAMTIHQCLSGIQGHQEAFEKSYALMQQLLSCTPAVEIANRIQPQTIPADVPPSFYNHPSSSQSSPILASTSDTSRSSNSGSKSRRSSLVSSGKRRVRAASHLDAGLGDATTAFPAPATQRLRSVTSKNRLSMPVMGFHQQGQHQQYMASYPQTPSPTTANFQSMAAADMYSQFGAPMMATASNPSPFYKQALRSSSAAIAAAQQQQLSYPRPPPEGPTPTTSTPHQHQQQQPYMNRVSANHRRHTISGSYQIDLQQQFAEQQHQQLYTQDIDMINLSQEQDMTMAIVENPMEPPNIHQDAHSESMMELLLNNSLQ